MRLADDMIAPPPLVQSSFMPQSDKRQLNDDGDYNDEKSENLMSRPVTHTNLSDYGPHKPKIPPKIWVFVVG